MKKFLLSLALTLALTASLLALTVGAADVQIFVADGGTGNGMSAQSPLGSLSAAIDALDGRGGEIVLASDTTVSAKTTVPEQSGDLTFSAVNGAKLLLKQRFQLAKNTNDNTVTFDLPVDVTGNYAVFMFGGFNNVVFGENFSVAKSGGSSAALDFFGGVHAGEVETNADCITELPYSITVNGGDFAIFNGGSFRTSGTNFVGAIAAPITVTVNGGIFGTAGSYDIDSNNQMYYGFSVSGDAILADDATLNITGGIFNVPVFMQGRRRNIAQNGSRYSTLTASDKKYYAIDGDLTLNISGGSFNGGLISAYQQQVSHAQVVRGNFDVTVTGTPTFAAGTVVDATAVKAYPGESKSATLSYPTALDLTVKCFDSVNGEAQSYTEPVRIACIGDSITEGYCKFDDGSYLDSTKYSYPAQLAKLVQDKGEDVLVANFGISSGGMTMTGNVIYFPGTLAHTLSIYESGADYVVFALGTNDASAAGASNGSEEWFVNEYSAYIKAVGDNPETKTVFVTNATHRNGQSVSSLRASSVIRPLQAQITETLNAADNGKYVFVDLYALTYEATKAGNFLSSDNIHPHKEGYGIMAQKIYDAVFNGITAVEGFRLTDIYVSDDGTPFGAGTADDPISYLSYAIDRMAIGEDVTMHVVGTLTYPHNSVSLPMSPAKLTIVGEGSGAKLLLKTAVTLKVGCPVVFDNLAVETGAKSEASFACRYNDTEIRETVSFAGPWCFYAGNLVNSDLRTLDPADTVYFDTVTSVSSDRDCTVTVNAGTWHSFFGGNRRTASAAPIGTYSGNMTLTVGGNASIVGRAGATGQTNLYAAVSGMNYLTGSITAEVSGWNPSLPLRDFAYIGSRTSLIDYAPSNNTGSVTLTTTADTIVSGDMDANGTLDIVDALELLCGTLGGVDAGQSVYFFDCTEPTLTDVLWLLRRIQN